MAGVLGGKVFAIGLQKSGTTVMSYAIASALNLSYQGEVVDACCRRLRLRAGCCADSHSLLFGGDMAALVRSCEPELHADVLKAADVVEEFPALRRALGRGYSFVYLVRHPISTIRSLQAWRHFLKRTGHYEGDALVARVFKYGGRTEELARKWSDHAAVYARDPSAFRALLRYEDFLRHPSRELHRVARALLGEAHAPHAPHLDAVASAVLRRQHTDGGRARHQPNVSKLLPPAQRQAVERICADGMRLFGYSSRDSFEARRSCRWRSEARRDAPPPPPPPAARWAALSWLWRTPPPAEASPPPRRRVALATVYHEPGGGVGGRATCALLVHMAACAALFPRLPYVLLHDLPEESAPFRETLLPLLEARRAHAVRVPPLLRFGAHSTIRHGKFAASVNRELAHVTSMKLWALNLTQFDAVLYMDLDALPLRLPSPLDPFAALFAPPHAAFLGRRGATAPIDSSVWVARTSGALFAQLHRAGSGGFSPERGWAGYGRFNLTGAFAREAWGERDCTFWAEEVGPAAACGREASPLPWSFWAAEGDNGLLFWLYGLRAGDGAAHSFRPDLEQYLQVAHFTTHMQPWKPSPFFRALEQYHQAAKREAEENRAGTRTKLVLAKKLHERWCAAGHVWWQHWKQDVSAMLLHCEEMACVDDLNAVLKRHAGPRLKELCSFLEVRAAAPAAADEPSLWERLLYQRILAPVEWAFNALGWRQPMFLESLAATLASKLRVAEAQEKRRVFLARRQARLLRRHSTNQSARAEQTSP